jgi:quercetin dioxygenase-like cupin family protein
MKKLPLILSLAVLSFSAVVVKADEVSSANNTYTQAVTRDVLASGYPTQTQDQILELVRITIAPNAKLPVHIHPGMQTVQVESGTLTFTVVDGEARVTKADGTEIIIRSGETQELTVGDALVESAGMVHFGENLTDSPVVLLSASLMATDQPRAILVEPANP